MSAVDDYQYVPPGWGRSIWWLGGRGTFMATGADTAGGFALWQDAQPPHGGPIPHVHSREEEFFYVLAGELTYETAGQSFHAAPGAFVGLPNGVPHCFHNGPTPAKLLVFVAPAGNENMFLELGTPDSEPIDGTDPPDVARFEAAARKHGVTLLKPDGDWQKQGLAIGTGRTPTLLRPGEGDRFEVSGVTVTLKVGAGQTAGAYMLCELHLPAKSGWKQRDFAGSMLGFYVLEGTPTFQVGSRVLRAAGGGFVTVAGGKPLTLQNLSNHAVRLLMMTTPAGAEAALRADRDR